MKKLFSFVLALSFVYLLCVLNHAEIRSFRDDTKLPIETFTQYQSTANADLANEVSSRTNADNAIRNDVAPTTTTVAVNLNNEISSRTNADNDLNTQITSTYAANALAISSETTNRQNADVVIGGTTNYLQEQITAVSTSAVSQPEFNAVKISTGVAYVLIASSYAPAYIKAKAQYVCNGVNDQSTIQNAINSIGSGIVELSIGNFVGNATMSNPVLNINDNVVLKGQGKGTVFSNPGNEGDLIRLHTNSGIKDMSFTMDTGGVINQDAGENNRIENCFFNGQYVILPSQTNLVVKNNVFDGSYLVVKDLSKYCEITGNYIKNAGTAISVNTGGGTKPHHITVIGNRIYNCTTGYEINADNSIIVGNFADGVSTVINMAGENNYGAGNSWQINYATSTPANYDAQFSSIPVLFKQDYDLQKASAGAQAQIDVIVSTEIALWTKSRQNETAISTNGVVAYSVSTSAVRISADGDVLCNGKIDVGAEEYSLIYTTYTLDLPIAFSSNTETGDFGEFESASSFTITSLFFTSRTTAPISNVTFAVQRQTTGANLMNGSLLLSAGATQSAVFTSTNVIPANGGIKVTATGRSNGMIHAVFKVFKQRGQ